MALTGHSGMHTAQSMHSSGSITSMFGPSRKQSTGQTSTQSVYLHLIQDSVTTWVMFFVRTGETLDFIGFWKSGCHLISTAPEVLWLAVSTSTSEPRMRERW